MELTGIVSSMLKTHQILKKQDFSKRAIAALLGGVSLCALSLAPSMAQEISPDAQLLLNADEVEYDFDNDRVAASGAVQIEYDGYRLVADRVVYNQTTGRLLAIGDVEIVDREGNVITSDKIDITDDFGDGFVDALRLETIDNTRFAAASARREGGNITTFTKGVYTACEPCKEKPGKAPIWQVKGEKIIWNQDKKTIRFEGSRFEFFGKPLLFLPSFEIADHTVTRESGFLIPSASYSSELGASASVPYFLVVSPTADVTFTPTYFTKQGFLGEAEWRQAFSNGIATLKIAGIDQADPNAFDAGSIDSEQDRRWMIGTTGKFKINPRWSFGWNVLHQSDNNFSNTYGIDSFDATSRKSNAYLTGLSGKNYFNLEAARFEVQGSEISEERQARVLPSFDYSYTWNNPVLGGELNFDINSRNIDRQAQYKDTGINGRNGRFSGEAEWQRTFITQGGLALTPMFALRGDAFYANDEAVNANYLNTQADVKSEFYQYMATAGLEARYPILFSAASSTHILEPVAQIFARPNARGGNSIDTINEDAQSFVFDAANLFERDKFSGWDRVEGGVRANVGFRYSGDFDNGLRIDATVGQSYHLAGENPFSSPDLLYVGHSSGLETDVSDFVAGANFSYLSTFSLGTSFRFDKDDLSLARTELTAGYANSKITLAARYANIAPQTDYGFQTRRQEISGSASLKFAENWTLSGAASYDIEQENLYSHSISLAYDDECFRYGMSYRNTNPVVGDQTHTVGVSISLRTIGDFDFDRDIDRDSF